MFFPALLSIALVFSLILPASVLNMAYVMAQEQVTPMVAAGWHHTVGLKADGTVVAVGDNDDGQCDVGGWTDITQVAAGGCHTVGVKSDGTVVAVGRSSEGQCSVSSWTNITQVAAGDDHTVGLKSDGTVVAVGWNNFGQCDVGNWTGIIQVAAGDDHTVGLKSDGTVVAVGWNNFGQCDVGNWTDVVQVAAGGRHTVGLKSDGTVVAVGNNRYLQCDVDSWTDITQEAAIENVIWVLESYGEAGNLKAVLKYTEITARFDGARVSGSAGCNTYSGGYELKGNNISITELRRTERWCPEKINKQELEYLTALRDAKSYEIEGEKLRIHCGKQLLVFNVSYNRYGQWDTGGWTDIIQVAAGGSHTVGVKSDGTVVAVGDNSHRQCNFDGWTGITQVAAGLYHTVGLKSDGTVVAVGYNWWGQCNIGKPWWPWIIVAAAVGLVVFFVRRRGRGPADT